ncbi:MAG TPA: lamin tail domain-containing protein [Chitinophagaceae bacterium]|nr:lamin tail domain-containing protein [Chitinophagaceae bacterium]
MKNSMINSPPWMKRSLLFIAALMQYWLHAQDRYTVVINEIMADPTPSVQLPEYEWVELINTGPEPVNLRNWRLGDATSLSGPFPEFLLQPDSLVIICSGSARPFLQPWGQTLTVTSFPSLNNDGEQLFLQSADGRIMHAVRYSVDWYANPLKQEGGWSLEMIDASNPCSGSGNWKASVHPAGGTPGRSNSARAVNPDTSPPEALRSYMASPTGFILLFNEPLDSLYASTLQHYTADHGLSFTKASCLPPLFSEVRLETNNPVDSQIVYNITINQAKDCRQNEMTAATTIKAGTATDPGPGELIINEILSDPKPNAYDYVELYNPGPKIFDAGKLYISNRSSNGQINTPIVLSPSSFTIFPGDHIILTEKAASLALNYLVKNPMNVLEARLPSYPDDKGTVLLLNAQGLIIDEVNYTRDWHFKLIDNPEGVSLERIDPSAPSSEPTNWHSAASTAGFGTPTYINSQSRKQPPLQAQFEITPTLFSPDNDGYNDITTLCYKTTEPGLVASIVIFDAGGRLVKHLARNSLLGNNGHWNWDGTDNKGQLLPIGIYIIQTELFNLNGNKQKFRHAVVLAKRLN